jgi:1,4-dihydroxy-6-naphthoate synthase
MKQLKEITIAHTPDADDAFMFYALTCEKLKPTDFQITHVLKPIQELNHAAREGTYEMSALSIAAYPSVSDKYWLMDCGACMGFKFGPMLLSNRSLSKAELEAATVGIPGKLTTAYMLLKMFQPKCKIVEIPFDKIVDSLLVGEIDAGLIIHEAQMTYEKYGLEKIVDLGLWWYDETGLPLPLGGNVIRKDLPSKMASQLSDLFRKSIKYSLANRRQAVDFALPYARGIDVGDAMQFIGRYVNELTIEYGDTGKRALEELFERAYQSGAIQSRPQLQFAP